MKRVFLLGVCCAVALFAVAMHGPARAESRVALVIGNSAYEHAGRLANPQNDARDIAAALRGLNFQVMTAQDLGAVAFELKINDFVDKARGADVALFFYAGHAMQLGRTNYLMPVDARLASELSVKRETIAAQDIVELMEGAAKMSIVLLDACRNNPLADRLRRRMGSSGRSGSLGRGLGRIAARGRDTLIVYAAEPGRIAADGHGRNSPFTAGLLRHIATLGLEIEVMLKRVTKAVRQATGGTQNPERLSRLETEFYFRPRQIQSSVVSLSDADRIRQNGAAVPVTQCDWLAASPSDEQRVVPGIEVNEIKPAEAVPACRQALAQYPGTTRFQFQLGRALHRSKHYEKARFWYNKAVAKDHIVAMNNLGILYSDGYGVRQDYTVAKHLYLKAIDGGYAIAMFNLAGLFKRGFGVRKDYGEAMRWYRKAATKGVSHAMDNIGLLYLRGNGVRRDNAEAVRWFRKAADKGNASAMINLGVLYANGQGMEKDYEQANKWYRKAAKEGNSLAMYGLGRAYNQGFGVEQNDTVAAEWIYKALMVGNAFTVKQMTTNSSAWSEDFRRELQRHLKEAGYFGGTISGNFDQETIEAIKKLAKQ